MSVCLGANSAAAPGLFRWRGIRWQQGALILLAGFLLQGCATIYRARQAQKSDQAPPGERTVTAAELSLGEGTTLTLDQAIEIALQYQPAMIQAQQNLVIAQKQTRLAISGYIPSLTAQGSYRRATSNAQAPASTTPGLPAPPPPGNKSSDSWSAGISAEQLIWDFGRTDSAIRQAHAQQRAAEANLLAATNTVAFQVKSAYYQLAQAQALARVAEDTVHQFQVHLDQVQVLVEVGRRIQYDATKAQVDLGNAELTLISARNTIKTSRAALNQAMGLAEEPGYQITEPPAVEQTPTLEELMTLAREHQPELQAAIAEEKAASMAVNGAIANLFPSITFSAGYNWTGADFPLVWNWFISPAVVIQDLLAIPRKTSQIDQAVAQLRSARARRAAQEQQIYLDLSQAVAQREDAQQRLELTNLVVVQAQENLNLVNERYQVGRASAVEQTDAQVALSQAQSNQVTARFDSLAAAARIQRTIGEK